jgi:FKBP-type peptidyl-prolyl cis-trans isomerase
MKRSIIFLSLFATCVCVVSCNLDFKKTSSGLVYKIFHKGKSSEPLAKERDWLKLNYTLKLNDSLVYSSYGKMPGYAPVVPTPQRYFPDEVFPMMRKGDSAIIIQSVDTLIKMNVAQRTFPFAKKGDRIKWTFKIIDIFHNDSLKDVDYQKEFVKDQPRQQKEMEEQQMKAEKEAAAKTLEQGKEIEKYLASKNITATKSPKGAYIQMISQGSGPEADSGKYLSFKYTGRNFKGQVFDSNIDTAFHHTEPYSVTVGQGGVIRGLDDAFKLLRQGDHVILYIPGALAYGPNPQSPEIGAWENLIFDTYIVEVKDSPPPPQPAPQQKIDKNQKK